MAVPSHLDALVRAGLDLDLYRSVYRQRVRRTLVYLLVLAVVAAAGFAAAGTLALRRAAKRIDPHLDKIPTIIIRDGEASADVPQPWRLRLDRDERGRELVLIIDTTGTLTDFEPHERGLFLQKQHLLVKGDDGETQVVPLERVPDTELGPERLRELIARTLRKVPPLLFLLGLVYYLVVRALQALLLVLVAMAASGTRRRPLRFGQLYNISVYALTPAVLLDVAHWFVPFRVPWFFALYFVVALLSTILGASRVPDEEA
jgi:hypothetical protein